MKLETAKKLVEIGEEGGLKCSLRETAGVVTESIPDLLYLAGKNDIDISRDYKTDNMGLDYIIY